MDVSVRVLRIAARTDNQPLQLYFKAPDGLAALRVVAYNAHIDPFTRDEHIFLTNYLRDALGFTAAADAAWFAL